MKISQRDMRVTLAQLKLASDAQFISLVRDSRRCIDCGASYEACKCVTTEAEHLTRLPVSTGDIQP